MRWFVPRPLCFVVGITYGIRTRGKNVVEEKGTMGPWSPSSCYSTIVLEPSTTTSIDSLTLFMPWHLIAASNIWYSHISNLRHSIIFNRYNFKLYYFKKCFKLVIIRMVSFQWPCKLTGKNRLEFIDAVINDTGFNSSFLFVVDFKFVLKS